MTSATWLLLHLSMGSVSVGGDSACPTPQSVERRLEGLLGTAGIGPGESRAQVSGRTGRIQLELRGADGLLLGARELPASTDCEALATAAAVVFATWLSDLLALRPAPSSPRATARAPAPSRAAPTPPLPDPPVSPPAPTGRVQLGAGFLVSVGGPAPTLGAEVIARMEPSPRRWGLAFSLASMGSRSTPVGDEVLRSDRYAAVAGPSYRAVEGELGAVVDLRLAASVVATRTEGGSRPSGAHFESGAGLGLSIAHRRGVWLSVGGLHWLRGPGLPRALPRFELLIGTGLAWGDE